MQFPTSPVQIFYFVVATHAIRYFVIAGIAFLFWYILLKNKVSYSKIQLKFPKPTDYQREILHSILTFIIFGIVGTAIYNPIIRPYTQTYFHIEDYGIGYFILSFFLTLIIHDTYFYWMHRLMHHPSLFKYFHKVHHQSTNPSPWTAFSFQPLEGFVEAGIFIIFAFMLPLHPIIIITFFFFMTTYNVYGHLGWELIPKGGNKHWFWKWFNSSLMHNQHHHYFKNNYGLYFSFWDKTMGTMDKNYDVEFEELKTRTN